MFVICYIFNAVDKHVIDDVTATRFKRAGNFGSPTGRCVKECKAEGHSLLCVICYG